MRKFDIKEMIEIKSPDYFSGKSILLSRIIIRTLDYFFQTDVINEFLARHNDKWGVDFLDAVLDHLDFKFLLSNEGYLRVPAKGRLIIVSNHPLGALDGIALVKAICQIRSDVKIIVYDMFMKFDRLREFFLPFDGYTSRSQRKEIAKIMKAIRNEEAIVFFPAGEVSRLTWKGITDRAWQIGPVYLAKRFRVPILPVYIHARNSFLFYVISILNKNLSSFMLAYEMVKTESKSLKLEVGNLIPSDHFLNTTISEDLLSKRLREHTYGLGKNKDRHFNTG